MVITVQAKCSEVHKNTTEGQHQYFLVKLTQARLVGGWIHRTWTKLVYFQITSFWGQKTNCLRPFQWNGGQNCLQMPHPGPGFDGQSFKSFFLLKKNAMLTYQVVCCSHQSDSRIRVCSSHQSESHIRVYISHQSDHSTAACLHQSESQGVVPHVVSRN